MEKNKPQFFTETNDAWEAMLAACENARESIDIEQYILTPDSIGERFIHLFIRKAREGVKIRILCDTVGSYGFFNSSIPDELRRIGIEVRFFNIISSWRIPNILSWYFRTHRKIMIIDHQSAFVGGVGIREDMRDWRDTEVHIDGSIIKEIQDTFEEMWKITAEDGVFARIKKFRFHTIGTKFITNAPYPRRRFLYHRFVEVIRGSRKYVYLTTPYLVPDRRFLRVLRLAAYRGVDVRIMVPRASDFSIVHRAAHSFFTKLLSYGIRIYEYEGRFLHAKTAVIDDEWATLGSFNLDSFSFTYNHEANVVSTDSYFIETLKNHFEHDMVSCREVLKEEWDKRPMSWKIREWFIMPFRRFL